MDAADLIAAMTPLTPAPAGAYFWGAGNQRFQVQAAGATTTVLRRLAEHSVRRTPVTASGLVGTLYTAGLAGRHSAVLLNCGGLDDVWASCPHATAVMARLARSKFPHQLQVCGDCDHVVGSGVPAEPYARTPGTRDANDIRAFPHFFTAVMKLLGS